MAADGTCLSPLKSVGTYYLATTSVHCRPSRSADDPVPVTMHLIDVADIVGAKAEATEVFSYRKIDTSIGDSTDDDGLRGARKKGADNRRRYCHQTVTYQFCGHHGGRSRRG